MKPHLKVVQGQPVVVADRSPSSRETPIAAARRRAGGVFGWERKDWQPSDKPKVLTLDWQIEQQEKRRGK